MQLPRKMSAHIVMASISRSLSAKVDNNTKHSNEVKLAGEESKDKLYEPKHRQKVVRVLTVVAYVVSVSLAAILLSLYYTFIWDPKDHAHYIIRQNSLNSSAKVECLNLTIPMSVGLTGMNGSNITRLTNKSLTNDMEPIEKFQSNFSPESDVSFESVPDSTRVMQQVIDSATPIVPVIVQPDPESIGKDQFTEDIDFDPIGVS